MLERGPRPDAEREDVRGRHARDAAGVGGGQAVVRRRHYRLVRLCRPSAEEAGRRATAILEFDILALCDLRREPRAARAEQLVADVLRDRAPVLSPGCVPEERDELPKARGLEGLLGWATVPWVARAVVIDHHCRRPRNRVARRRAALDEDHVLAAHELPGRAVGGGRPPRLVGVAGVHPATVRAGGVQHRRPRGAQPRLDCRHLGVWRPEDEHAPAHWRTLRAALRAGAGRPYPGSA